MAETVVVVSKKIWCPKCAAAALITKGVGVACSDARCDWRVSFGLAGEWIHDLKCQRQFFVDVKEGRKTFEVRLNDRGFRRGHRLRLIEQEGGRPTGRTLMVVVEYMLVLEDVPGLRVTDSRWVVLGITLEKEATANG